MSFFDVATNMGGNSAQIALIDDLARDLGFRQVTHYSGLVATEELTRKVPNNFFLFASDGELEPIKTQVQNIRSSPRPRVRYSPLICFVEVPLPMLVSQCIQIGFDDILTLPWDPKQMMPRLRRQLNTPITYFETSTYFGPDRRRFGKKRPSTDKVYHKSQGYRRIDIRRDLAHGVQILGDTTVGNISKRHSHVSWSAAG
ncbi:hypothetical protein [Maritalea myrionectae]|uniref:Uncharacterized protein n=1 Tax=Maritalea myrionectae TaxID=454601 RepID=A0A2R4M9J3_9HYPH|nr:hypothetical protein [Maritalea myrionectae]AVX02707.1 hypothetical protein MXMO3_00159 [Maritalea myrionectae]